MTKLAGGGLIAQPRVDTSEAVAVDWRKGTVGHRLGHGRIESAAAAAAYQRSQVAGHMPASAAAAMAAYRRMEGSKMAPASEAEQRGKGLLSVDKPSHSLCQPSPRPV